MPFAAMAVSADNPFLRLSFVDSLWVLYVSILWIPSYLMLICVLLLVAGDFWHCLSLSLLLSVHHRACALLGLILDPVSWHNCGTSCSWTAVTAVRMSLTVP